MLAMIVPSRGRPAAVKDMADAFLETRQLNTTRLVWAVDRSDPKLRQYKTAVTRTRDPLISLLVVAGGTMVAALNEAAAELTADQQVEAVGFLGDDHRPRTRGWDAAFLTALREPGVGMVYGDDLFSSDFVPTHIAMRSSIIYALGWMVHPDLRHMYVDTLWRDLGNTAGVLRYLKDEDPARTVVVEHMHYQNGKAAEDAGYKRVNAPEVYSADEQVFGRLTSSGEIVRYARLVAKVVGAAR
jgi:hypothetical protein